MYDDLKKFIRKIIEDDEKYKDDIIRNIDIKIDGRWYDYVVYFKHNSKHNFTCGGVEISSFDKILRLKKLNKLEKVK